jgi:ATP/maltotriose-dependent transcriptional regulator MalT
MLASFREIAFRSTAQALLAEVHELLGDRDAALRAIELSDELSGAEDMINPIITHRVRARLAVTEGDHAAAERWARRAAEIASLADWPMTRGDT